MGKVISGEYTGCKVDLSGKYKCLYIKSNGGAVPLDSIRVKQYRLKEVAYNPFLSFSHIVLIEWNDGKKSVVGIEKAYMTWLVSGCETVEVYDAQSLNKHSNVTTIIIAVILSILLMWGVSSAVNQYGDYEKTGHTETAGAGTWAEWDGISKRPDASMLIQTTDTLGLTSTSGVVSGYFVNNSPIDYRHLEVIYGVYDASKYRMGECTFSTNNVTLQPGQQQEFTAECNAWGNMPIIRLESVGFKVNPI